MGLPPDGLQAWASRGRRGALGASGVFGRVVNGNFSGVRGIRGDTESRCEGTVPRDDRSRPLKGRGALEGSFVLWKKGRRRGRERMDWRGRTVGRGYSRVGGQERGTAPRLPAPWGSGDVPATGATVTPAEITEWGGGGLASASSPPLGGARRLPAEPLPPPCPVPAPLGASCAPLEEVGIGVFPLQPCGLFGYG